MAKFGYPDRCLIKTPFPSRNLIFTIKAAYKPRTFIASSHLRFIRQPCSRPQLPFLSTPLHFRTVPSPQSQGQQQYKAGFQHHWQPQLSRLTSGQLQLVRLLTTERKNYIKDQVWLGGKFALFGYVTIILLLIASTDYYLEVAEYRHPSPPEWSLWTRVLFRFAKAAEDESSAPTESINWVDVWTWNKRALARLEDGNGSDGKGVSEVLDGGIAISRDGSISAGLDVSGKSEPWRRGYCDTLMSMARAAEYIEGWVKDRTQNIYFPPEYVVGNDDLVEGGSETTARTRPPKPVPPEKGRPPLASNCEVVANSPQTIYSKILTTRGFTTTQRVDAALAYASWLEFKGMFDAAKEVYHWALDIASSILLDGTAATSKHRVEDLVRPEGPIPSKNILKASTAYAVHLASYRQDFQTALSILLSVLAVRRRALPDSAISSKAAASIPSGIESSNSSATENTNYSLITSILHSRRYPPPPTSGDDKFTRGQTAECDDAAIMLNIGEILFATGSQLVAGVQWTRQGTQLAESRWRDSPHSSQERERCKDCLKVGLDNWKAMMTSLARMEREEVSPEKLEMGNNELNLSVIDEKEHREHVIGNLSQPLSRKGITVNKSRGNGWQEEERRLEAWITRVKSEILTEELREYDNSGNWFFLK